MSKITPFDTRDFLDFLYHHNDIMVGISHRTDHQQRRGDKLIVINAITMALATLLVAARLYVRSYIFKRLWWDDLVITIAMVIDSIFHHSADTSS